jgi:hypothetical protein
MAIAPLPDFVLAQAEPAMSRLATDLAAEGARGGAARRLLARDVAIRRARLRYLEGLQAVHLKRAANDATALQQAVAIDKLVEAEHRRLLASLDALARLEPQPAAVHVRAHQAAVVVGR